MMDTQAFLDIQLFYFHFLLRKQRKAQVIRPKLLEWLIFLAQVYTIKWPGNVELYVKSRNLEARSDKLTYSIRTLLMCLPNVVLQLYSLKNFQQFIN